MSNRRKPTHPELSLHQFRFLDGDIEDALDNLDQFRCPDCNSEFDQPVRHGGQVASIQIRHDSTCPWYRTWAP